jgi:hypothetical protein
VNQLKRDLDLLQIKITSRVAEGEHLAGQSMDFQKLIKMYEKMAEVVDEQNQYEQEDMVDDFLSPLESDPSKAELMCIC